MKNNNSNVSGWTPIWIPLLIAILLVSFIVIRDFANKSDRVATNDNTVTNTTEVVTKQPSVKDNTDATLDDNISNTLNWVNESVKRINEVKSSNCKKVKGYDLELADGSLPDRKCYYYDPDDYSKQIEIFKDGSVQLQNWKSNNWTEYSNSITCSKLGLSTVEEYIEQNVKYRFCSNSLLKSNNLVLLIKSLVGGAFKGRDLMWIESLSLMSHTIGYGKPNGFVYLNGGNACKLTPKPPECIID